VVVVARAVSRSIWWLSAFTSHQSGSEAYGGAPDVLPRVFFVAAAVSVQLQDERRSTPRPNGSIPDREADNTASSSRLRASPLRSQHGTKGMRTANMEVPEWTHLQRRDGG
jgi:hypothetical protein